MTTNSNFNFVNNTYVTLELPFSEHMEELRQRTFLLFGIILSLSLLDPDFFVPHILLHLKTFWEP